MSNPSRRLGGAAIAIVLSCVILVGCGPANEGSGSPVSEPPVLKAKTPADPELLAEGKVAWRSCAKCHCVTDPGVAEDEDWVVMNEETTCIAKGDPAPRLRQAIMAHLRHPGSLRPVLVREGRPVTAEKAGKAGKITLPATAGSAYLRADRESVKAGAPAKVRLAWAATDDDKEITAPAGRYDVINFWFYRRSEPDGDRWMVTGTNVNGCTSATIGPGDAELLDVEPLLYGKLAAARKDGRFALTFSCQDTGGSRMTLSRNGRVVLPGFRIKDGAGHTVAEGRFAVI